MALHAYQEISPNFPNEKQRRETSQYVINSMGLEGVTLDTQTLDLFEAYNRGDISAETLFELGMQRIIATQNNK